MAIFGLGEKNRLYPRSRSSLCAAQALASLRSCLGLPLLYSRSPATVVRLCSSDGPSCDELARAVELGLPRLCYPRHAKRHHHRSTCSNPLRVPGRWLCAPLRRCHVRRPSASCSEYFRHRERLKFVLKQMFHHGRNLGLFVLIYKSICCICRNTGFHGGKESLLAGFIGALHCFFADTRRLLLSHLSASDLVHAGGFIAFGDSHGVSGSVNMQLVLYLFARCVLLRLCTVLSAINDLATHLTLQRYPGPYSKLRKARASPRIAFVEHADRLPYLGRSVVGDGIVPHRLRARAPLAFFPFYYAIPL